MDLAPKMRATRPFHSGWRI